jgi:tRNA nucleotidyltransferase (CCA-adding enzyme)
VPLVEDLARRDLTVNAIAYDIARNEIVDPFDGRADIDARRLRAVGAAVDRFTEDGLRVMRAVRFAAQLEFDLDPSTEAGIPPALPSLSRVSRERVCEELRKILKAAQPSRGLRPALRSGIIANILPELAVADHDAWLARIDRADADVRLALVILPIGEPQSAADILKDLKFSNTEIEIAQQMLRIADTSRLRSGAAAEVRRMLASINKRREALQFWAAIEIDPQIQQLARTIVTDKHPLDARDLAIKGKDLMDALQLQPGPVIGRILDRLVDLVLDDPARNTRDTLLAHARTLHAELAP